jgi:predicted porin
LIYTVKLAALATLAATTGAFAQSTVTFSGVLDYSFANQTGTIAGVKGTTVSTNIGTSATSVINIIAVEDLGGGMKATAKYGLDPRSLANDNTTSLARDEVFMGLSGGFGNIRLGSPNSLTLATFLGASPLGTGIGSGYSPLEFGLTAGPRYNRSVRYDSPSFSGLTLSAIYAPGNDTAATASAAANGIPNARPTTEVGAAYSNGPLNVNLAYRTADAVQYAASAFETRAATGQVWLPGAATNAAGVIAKSTWTTLSANYKFGNTTVYAGWNDGKTTAAAVTEGYRVGLKHDMGAISLIGSYAAQKTAGVESTFAGLRADYALSKRTVAYVGTDSYDNGAASANTRKITSVGVRHAF